jgi:hypothetical protein
VKKLRFGGNSAPYSTRCFRGEIDFDLLLQALFEYQPGASEQIAGYELYALDCTPNEREEAEMLGAHRLYPPEPLEKEKVVQKGTVQPPRQRFPVVKKAKMASDQPANAI